VRKAKIITIVISAVFIAALFYMPVFATHGFSSMAFRIFVDGNHPFEVWGYGSGEIDISPSLRLRDVAFMLNGTPAQFDIIIPPEGSGVDFWIKRGAPYTPSFTELQEIRERRNALFGAYGFLPGDSRGFVRDPFQRVTIGFDGGDFSANIVSIVAVVDVDDTFFPLECLAYWLGFEINEGRWGWNFYISTTPNNRPTPSRHITRDTFPIGSRQVIAAHTLTVRTGAGDRYDVLTFVNRGEEFEILDYNGRFVQIYTNRGKGWIFAGFLSRTTHAAPRPKAAVSDAELSAVLAMIGGRWVDRVFYYPGEVIGISDAMPWNISVLGDGISDSLLPVSPLEFLMGAFPFDIKPLKLYGLEDGIAELRYDFSRPVYWGDHGAEWFSGWRTNARETHENRRIIIDTNTLPIETIHYYIGETVYTMVRHDRDRILPSRYTIDAVDGGIRLAWRFPRMEVWIESGTLRLYRSTVRGEKGTLLKVSRFGSRSDSSAYEFIDTDISDSGTYFYSLWIHTGGQQGLQPVLFDGEWQMIRTLQFGIPCI